MDAVIVLVGVRGDPGFLSRQMSSQVKNWKTNENTKRKKLVMVGPVFGSQSLACTPKEYPKEHPDTSVMHFMIDAIRNPTIDVSVVPAKIDRLLMSNFRENSKFLSGNSRQKSSFGRILNAHMKDLQGVMHSSLKTPVTVRKTKNTEMCCELLKNVPTVFWPTAFEINGQTMQPLGASCYFGSGGNELQGMLATSLFKSLRECRSAPLKFHETYIADACRLLEQYQAEIADLQLTCFVYDDEKLEGYKDDAETENWFDASFKNKLQNEGLLSLMPSFGSVLPGFGSVRKTKRNPKTADLIEANRDLEADIRTGALSQKWKAKETRHGVLFTDGTHYRSSYPLHSPDRKKIVERKLREAGYMGWQVGYDHKNKVFTYKNSTKQQYMHPSFNLVADTIDTVHDYVSPHSISLNSSLNLDTSSFYDQTESDQTETDQTETYQPDQSNHETSTRGLGFGVPAGDVGPLLDFIQRNSWEVYSTKRQKLETEFTTTTAELHKLKNEFAGAQVDSLHQAGTHYQRIYEITNQEPQKDFGSYTNAYDRIIADYKPRQSASDKWATYTAGLHSSILDYLLCCTAAESDPQERLQLAYKCMNDIQLKEQPTVLPIINANNIEEQLLEQKIQASQLALKDIQNQQKMEKLEKEHAEVLEGLKKQDRKKVHKILKSTMDWKKKNDEIVADKVKEIHDLQRQRDHILLKQKNCQNRIKYLKMAGKERDAIKQTLDEKNADIQNKEQAIERDRAAHEQAINELNTQHQNELTNRDTENTRMLERENDLQEQLAALNTTNTQSAAAKAASDQAADHLRQELQDARNEKDRIAVYERKFNEMFTEHLQKISTKKQDLEREKATIKGHCLNAARDPRDPDIGDAMLGPRHARNTEKLERITEIEHLIGVAKEDVADTATKLKTESIREYQQKMADYEKDYPETATVEPSTGKTESYMVIYNSNAAPAEGSYGILLIYQNTPVLSSTGDVWRLPYGKTSQPLAQLVIDETHVHLRDEEIASPEAWVQCDFDGAHISEKRLMVQHAFRNSWIAEARDKFNAKYWMTPPKYDYAWLYVHDDKFQIQAPDGTNLPSTKDNLPDKVVEVVNKVRHDQEPATRSTAFGKIQPERAKTSRSRRTKALI